MKKYLSALLIIFGIASLSGCQKLSDLRTAILDRLENAKQTAEEVKEQINETKTSIENKVNDVKNAAKEVKEAGEQVKEAVDALNKITE